MDIFNNHGAWSRFRRQQGLRKAVDTSGYVNMSKLQKDFLAVRAVLPQAVKCHKNAWDKIHAFTDRIPALPEYKFKLLTVRVEKEGITAILMEIYDKELEKDSKKKKK